jgi:hypothetical protein
MGLASSTFNRLNRPSRLGLEVVCELRSPRFHGGFFGMGGEAGGALAKAVRILQADSDL